MHEEHAGFRGARFAPWGLSLGLWLISVGLVWPSHGALLNWDEVDYVLAARQGVVSNALERGSLSPAAFLRFARTKLSGNDPLLPLGYDEAQDSLLLRHYHPPFVVFLLSPVAWVRNERLIRSVQLLGALALVLAIVFSYWTLSDHVEWAGIAIVSLLALWMTRLLFATISFHGWEAVWATAVAALLGRAADREGWRVDPVLAVCLALAALTLETGLLVWLGAAAWFLLRWLASGRQTGHRSPLWQMALAAALAVGIVLLLWPGALLRASIIKIPALYLYRIYLGEEYASVPTRLADVLWSLLPLAILGPLSCLWLLRASARDRWRWSPFMLIGGLYGIVMVPFALQPQYLLPALAPLVPLVGAASDRVPSMAARLPAILLVGLGLVFTWPGTGAAADRAARADLHWLGEVLRGREALVDGGHIYRYYLGDGYSVRPLTVSYQGDRLSVREAGRYQDLEPRAIAGKVVVIQGGRTEFFSGGLARTLLAGCAKTERPTFTVYDCPAEAR